MHALSYRQQERQEGTNSKCETTSYLHALIHDTNVSQIGN